MSECSMCQSQTTEPFDTTEAKVREITEAVELYLAAVILQERACPVCSHIGVVANLIGHGAGLHGDAFLNLVQKWITDLRHQERNKSIH